MKKLLKLKPKLNKVFVLTGSNIFLNNQNKIKLVLEVFFSTMIFHEFPAFC
jgi:hypothetical protein